MTKVEFINKYQSLIRVHFDYDELLDSNIHLSVSIKNLEDFSEFYIPRYSRQSLWDNRAVEQIAVDDSSILVQFKDVISNSNNWGLNLFENAENLSKNLWPIPLATDLSINKTLILDGTNTVCTLLAAGININVKCIEVVEDKLSRLGTDLRLMQR